MEHRAEGCTSPFGTGSRRLLRRLKEEGSYDLEHFWIPVCLSCYPEPAGLEKGWLLPLSSLSFQLICEESKSLGDQRAPGGPSNSASDPRF